MPNWCYSGYSFQFENERVAEKFEELLKKATDSSNPVNLKGQSFGSNWLGNVLIACGYPVSYKDEVWGTRVVIGDEKHHAPAYNYRGSISYFDRSGNTVTVNLETAWAPMPGVLATALYAIGLTYSEGMFDDVSVHWMSEEPGCEYFGGSDSQYCDGDIRVYSEIPMKLYDNDEKLRDIFDSEDMYDDDGTYYISQYDYTGTLLKDINSYLGTEEPFLDDAIKALEKKSPDINISYVNFQFEDWLACAGFEPETDVIKRLAK